MTQCVCPVAGYCSTHSRMMSEIRHRQCRDEPGYFASFQVGRNRQEVHRKPKSKTDLEALAALLAPGCNCDRKERAMVVGRRLARWPKPELNNGEWAVGVTTAPRKFGSSRPCLDSLRINGWRPHVFAEPDSKIDDLGDCELTQNSERLGAWRNFVSMSRQLLTSDAKLFLLVQDDTVVMPGARGFLEPRLLENWPKDGGMVSLYTASHYLKDNLPGCYQVRTSSLWGICATVFTRETLAALLDHPLATSWNGARFKTRTRPREPWEVANVDTAVGKILTKQGLGMFFYTPSLSQHVAPASSIGHGDDKGRRAAASVVSDWDIFSYWGSRKGMAYYRRVRELLNGLPGESLIDVGSGPTQVAQWGEFTKRYRCDIEQQPDLGGVETYQRSWLDLPPSRYSVATCLQTLEHLSDDDVRQFAQKLKQEAATVIVTVPHKWEMGKNTNHRQDPIDLAKVEGWFQQSAKRVEIITDRKTERLLCVF